MNSKPKQLVTMLIDKELHEKSKVIIPNRTKNYEDYLRRVINAGSRLEMLRMEKENLETKLERVKYEYEIEVELEEKQSKYNQLKHNELDAAVETVLRIVEKTGVIGLDKLEDIAIMKNVSISELKNSIPDINDKFVSFHPQLKEKLGDLS